MSDPAGVDLASFQAAVLEKIEYLRKLGTEGEQFYKNPPFRKTVKDTSGHSGCAVLASKMFINLLEALFGTTYRLLKMDRETLTKRATAVINRADVKARLCPALRGVEDDPVEISKAVTPILFDMARAGSMPLPLEVNLFAMIALVISQTGMDAYCSS